MRPLKDTSTPMQYSFASTVRYACRAVWSTGSGYVMTLSGTTFGSALLAPIAVLALSKVVASLEKSVSTNGEPTIALGVWILVGGLAALAGLVFNSLQVLAKNYLDDRLLLHMEQEILGHAAKLNLRELESSETQDRLERANQRPGQAVFGLVQGLLQVGSSVIQVVAFTGILIWIEPFWSLTLLLAALPLLLARMYLKQLHFARQQRKAVQRRWNRYYRRSMTDCEMAPVMKLFGLAPLFLRRQKETIEDLLSENRRGYVQEAAVNIVSALATTTLIAFTLWSAADRAATGEITVAAFTAFWVAAGKFSQSFAGLGKSLSSTLQTRLQIDRIREFLETRPQLSRGHLRPASFQGAISLRDVSFSYVDDQQPVLRNISLNIQPGEVVAIVGPNGAGKTTLAKLISRLYDPTKGEIRIDGTLLTEIDVEHYYRCLSYLPQKTIRFEATARENVAFGDWQQLLGNDEAVRDVARRTSVDKLIEAMPNGYETALGRMFSHHDLSGGQWQKLAMARALARDSSIVVLDEPAAHLDITAEESIHENIRSLLRGRTTILISHRFSTVRLADRICVLIDGEFVEQGTYDELISRRGTFAAMCQRFHANLGLVPPAA